MEIIQNTNSIERFSNPLEHDPNPSELCSTRAVVKAIPKPSGLGMVSRSTTSAASRKLSAASCYDGRRIIPPGLH